jgi:hypothetical protein
LGVLPRYRPSLKAQNVSGNRMTTAIKKILPYVLTSMFVVGLWWLFTRTDNYAWFPKGKETLMLDIALISIFYYKTLFWLVIANVTVFAVRQLLRKNYKTTTITALFAIVFYFLVGQVVDKKCAFHYYSVFHNQSVSEEYIDRPILEAGYQIGPIITENIADKEMKYRRYAIGGLEKIKYKPATQTLTKILLDKSELVVFRTDAYKALIAFDTEETRKVLTDFKNQATDSIDKKVVGLGEYFLKHS